MFAVLRLFLFLIPAALVMNALENLFPSWGRRQARRRIERRRRVPPTDDATRTENLRALTSEDAAEQRAAADYFETVADERAVEPLLQCLRAPEWLVRQSAVIALGHAGDPRAVEPLLEILGDPEGDSLRGFAADALGQIGDARAIPILIQALEDGEEATQAFARGALGLLPGAEDALISALRSPSAETRRAAADGLGSLGSSTALAALAAAIADPDSEVRAEVVRSIGETEHAEAPGSIVPALEDADSEVRAAAASAIADLPDAQSLPLLPRILSDPEVGVRYAALAHLHSTLSSPRVELIGNALRDEDEGVRRVAVSELSWYGRQDSRAQPHASAMRAVELLRGAASDPDPDVRFQAAVALGGFAERPEACELLAGLLRDGSARVREAATWSAGETLLDDLVIALCDEAPEVRAGAATGLGRLRVHAAVTLMSALLKDEHADVRRAAAEAIDKALPYRARVSQQLIDLVRVAVGDEDPSVRKSAEALSRHMSQA